MSPRNSKTLEERKDIKRSVRIGKGRGVRYRLGPKEPAPPPTTRIPYFMELEETKAQLNLFDQQNRVLVTKISSLLVASGDLGVPKKAAGLLHGGRAKPQVGQQQYSFCGHRRIIC